MKKEIKEIDYNFKVLYFFGIFFIVAGHCAGGGISTFSEWFPLYSFHLGLFVFTSGYFYREKNETLRAQIKSKAKKLLLPMYFWNIIYGLVVQLLVFKGFHIGGEPTLYNFVVEPIKTGHQFVWNLGTWFIWPLFLVEVIHMILCKVFYIKKEVKKCMLYILSILF